MGLVSPSQSSPGDEITSASINDPVNQIAAVVNGGIDQDNIADDGVGLAQIVDADQIAIAGSYLPQGGMVNGKIVTSVANNDLTVAIKTLAGNDPSVSDPVYARIGNSIRTITSALSKTLTDGTNWFNSGGGALATQDVDYFAYLIWNTTPATDAVTLGFARIPYGRTYADFSGTSTNDRYLAFSGSDTPTSTDEVEVIGRFNATLSATASFNWSIPATSIVISRPIYETRNLVFVPQWTNVTVGNATQTSRYKIRQDRLWTKIHFRWGTTTSFSGAVSFSLLMSATSEYGSTLHNELGTAMLSNQGVNILYGHFEMSNSASSVLVNTLSSSGANVDGAQNQITSTNPFTWDNTDEISGHFEVPIG